MSETHDVERLIEQLRTHEATNDIDKLLSRSGVSSALGLWGRLRDVGGMPPLQPRHVREIIHALYWAKKEARDGDNREPQPTELRLQDDEQCANEKGK